jgi:hypothetical protein
LTSRLIRRRATWLTLAFIASIVAATVVAIAVVDHRHKDSRVPTASLDEWYCRHRSTLCEREGVTALESSWSRRERIYKVAVMVSALTALTSLAVARRRQ